MKNLLLVLTLSMVTFSYAQRKPKIKGSREVVSLVKELPAFNAVVLKDDLEVTFVPASSAGYRLNADDNLIDVLKFSVADSTLTISSFYDITGKKKLEIEVNYEHLDLVRVQAGEAIFNTVLTTDQLDIEVLDDARIEMNSRASLVNLSMLGSSKGSFNIEADSLQIIAEDKIDADIYMAAKRTTVKLRGNADIELEGSADTASIALFDKSRVKAEKCVMLQASATLVGSSDLFVNVADVFTLSTRDDAKVEFLGNASINLTEFLGKSSIKRNQSE